MNDLAYIYYSIKSRALNSTLSVFLTAFGVLLALLINQFSNHVKNRLNADGKDIDIVIGAKGSPLQLVLSSVYHVDIPTGNIPIKSVNKIIKNPLIEKAIPLALGDNWKGYRIVGTTEDYIKHFNAEIDKGRLWSSDFEMIAGADINLKINEEITGSHGLIDGGGVHDDHNYKIIGRLKPTGSVLDRLLLTSVNSVLKIHGLESTNHNSEHKHKHEDHNEEHGDKHHGDHNEKHNEDHKHEHVHKKNDTHEKFEKINLSKDKQKSHSEKLLESEITALLIKTKSPIANINLPRSINRETNLQAANPALEITRLTTMLGLGSKSFTFLSTVLILIAILSIFSGLAGNLENRMGDLAILRALGYSKKRIFKIIALEGAFIISLGILLGIIMGFITFEILSQIITLTKANLINVNFTLIFGLLLAFASLFPIKVQK